MPEAPLDNPTSPQTRQRETAKPEQLHEPLLQRAVSEDTEPIAHTFDQDNTITRVRHKPGTPLPEQEAEPQPEPSPTADARKEQPVVDSPARVYAERDNIVHPGPTIEAVVTDEVAVGEPIPADPELVLRPLDEPLDEDETAEERLTATKDAVRDERFA